MSLVRREEIEAATLEGERVAVIGFGSQGRAQALNLRDSGIRVTVGLRSGSPSVKEAEAAGFEVETPAAAAAYATMVALLTPDETQPGVYAESIEPQLASNGALVFAHAFNVHYRRLDPRPDLDVLLVAPLGIGEHVRSEFESGRGTAGLLAVWQDASGRARNRGLGYARAQGHHRAALIETSFSEETETDIFAEQAILVGGLTRLIEAGFETLVAAGYQPEIAYFSCLEEVKYMAAMIHRHGLAGLWEKISSTAAYGALLTGPRVVNEASTRAMRQALGDIQSGRFAAELDREHGGAKARDKEASRLRSSLIEEVRRRLQRGE